MTTRPLLLLLALPLVACAPVRDGDPDGQPALETTGGDDADAWFRIHSPLLSDENGDGRWEEGEDLTLQVSFTNQRGDHFWYPGVLFTTDNDDVFLQGAEGWYYGIEAGATYEVPLTLTPATSLEEGTVVTVIASASSLACEGQSGDDAEEWCPEPNPLVVPVRIGDVLDRE